MNSNSHMISQIKKVAAALTVLLLIVSFQNCSEQKLSASGSSLNSSNGGAGGGGGGGNLSLGNTDNEATGVITQTNGPNCRNQLNQITSPIKPVFVVDISGSNKINSNAPGSDPDRRVRGDSIERFYNTYKDKTNYRWSFSTFAESTATVLLSMGTATQMDSAIQTFRAMKDLGATPYIPALDAAKNNIAADSGRLPGTKYIVLFLSDGMPNPDVADATLNSKVADIVGAVPGQVSFNTVYYGNVNPTASNRLKMMAQTGGGNFLDTNNNPSGDSFLITDLVIVPGVVCN